MVFFVSPAVGGGPSYQDANDHCNGDGSGGDGGPGGDGTACNCNVGYNYACDGSTLTEGGSAFAHIEGVACCWKMEETSTPSAAGEGHLSSIGMQLQFKADDGTTMRSDCQCGDHGAT